MSHTLHTPHTNYYFVGVEKQLSTYYTAILQKLFLNGRQQEGYGMFAHTFVHAHAFIHAHATRARIPTRAPLAYMRAPGVDVVL